MCVLVLAVGCTPPPLARPVDTLVRGHYTVQMTTTLGFGGAPRAGLDSETLLNFVPTFRIGFSERCDVAAGASMTASFMADVRCAALSGRRGDAINVVPYVATSFDMAAAFRTALPDAFGWRGGIDIARASGALKPVAGVGIGVVGAWYGDQTQEPPPDGLVGPSVIRREVWVEATIGVQVGTFDTGRSAVSMSAVPYWRIGDGGVTPDGFGVVLTGAAPTR